jgi:Glutamate-cysteine ligase family 2(GCS2)
LIWVLSQVVVGPCDTLHELKVVHETAVSRLVSAAKDLDMKVLGFGIQPLTPRGMDILTPRKRYEAMRKAMGESWFWFTVTASDQVHVDIAEPELLRVLNVRASHRGLCFVPVPCCFGTRVAFLCAIPCATGDEFADTGHCGSVWQFVHPQWHHLPVCVHT